MLKDAVLLEALPPRPLLPPFLGPGVGDVIGGGGEVVAMVAMVAMVVMVVMVHAASHVRCMIVGPRDEGAWQPCRLPLQAPIPITITRP